MEIESKVILIFNNNPGISFLPELINSELSRHKHSNTGIKNKQE